MFSTDTKINANQPAIAVAVSLFSESLYRQKVQLMTRFLVCALSIMTVSIVIAEEPPVSEPTHLTPLMRMKLDRSKAILEGLTLEDFGKIASNARVLHLLSTESGWNVIQTKEYASQSRDFRRSTELIAKAAEEKDISRATLGYVTMTVRCVECHSYMRKHRIELMKLEPKPSP